MGIVFDTRGYGERRTENGKRKSDEGQVSFSIPVLVWGFHCQPSMCRYRFRYPWLRGRVSFGVGIVFDTREGCGYFLYGWHFPLCVGYRFRYLWVKGAHLTFLGIVFDTCGYGGFPMSSSFPFGVGIVFDTCGCGGAYMCVGGAKVVGKISPPQKRVLRRVKSNF